MIPRRELRLMLAVSALAFVWPVGHALIGLGDGFMYLAPALVLLVPLLAGRYVGEERLLSVVRRIPPPRHRRARIAKPRLAREVAPPRGGCLIAFSLAVRPPPLLAF